MAVDLGKQVGPLPLGAWVAVVGGGLALAYFVNKGQSSGANDPVQLTESGVGVGAGGFTPVPPFADQPEETIEETNDAWGRKVADWLIAQGHDPSVSVNAVAKYLSGEQLTLQEKSLINLALVKHGTQPEPLPPASVTPTPGPTPTPTAPTIGITLTIQPKTSVRKGSGMTFAGFVVDSKGVRMPNRPVMVEYRNGGTTRWVPYPAPGAVSDPSGKDKGEWTFRTRAWKSRQWRFRVVGTNAVATSRFINVK